MSDAIFKLDATVRTDLGKGASRRLRHQDKVPAIIYGGDEAPVSITLEHNKVQQAQEFEAFYSHVLTINVDGKKVEALVKDMQRHPFKPKVTHIDFQRVVAGQALTTNVPIHFINEEESDAIKLNGGHAEHHMNDIEITCMPKNLPEFIEVDLLNIEIGQTIHLSDVKFPKGVESVELGKGEEHDLAVVTVKTARGPSVEEEAEDAAAEGDEGATEE
ncbi:50S ribosomal protein L25/general stress protein Ctc [Glaciecola sp.]|jgi:large subunit ribosomal protein L25|uniref:50S ribosomal protein L25/general stress protein Ctc n=1 Tax=Glaciecola sp. MF2-115 TaxID=3384827 RepID=UPI003988FF75|mmetsp:Transcript_51454/g.164547  ORF Transcript_51454/g.164547 Transcript_51454/m.164547 type:complete len:217 (+) Transcript_51454:208-858(+)|eukprot:CAMPEP_0182881356 /NCGR_PEP_ID=MMETSP0034_2-20130328/17128_1 /TAXON_ID=156128 /ORGANISM="Nephroselmis pyriformis, Strain CCMP717" /LENGTH=216 /DNA_ID=CAMNT_0025014385 /DNA_START=144 /DNA_END=794 /DNA_ORIENTATION=-